MHSYCSAAVPHSSAPFSEQSPYTSYRTYVRNVHAALSSGKNLFTIHASSKMSDNNSDIKGFVSYSCTKLLDLRFDSP